MRAMTSKQRKHKQEPCDGAPCYVNDWFEAAVLVVAGLAMAGGAYTLYLLYKAVNP